jgi:UDP-glucose-4-epimerase GalE
VENVLVTGGSGFIGSHVCKLLAGRGFHPVVYDNLSRGHRNAAKWGSLEVGDTADYDKITQVLRRYQPIAVMHFAALTYVSESIQSPLLYYRNNVGGTLALLDAVLALRRVPFIFSSTAATYGVPDRTPIPEDHVLKPINPYGWTKLIVEQALADISSAHGLPWIALRYFNAAGSDPDGEIGEEHDPETHLIPVILKAMLRGERVRIFGDDYPTPDGTCIRDYVHVMDIAEAHVLALDHLIKGGQSGVMNLANTKGYSVREVLFCAQAVCRKKVRFEVAPRRLGDPPVLIGSSHKAREVLGWRPRQSSLEQQIADAYGWFRSKRRLSSLTT